MKSFQTGLNYTSERQVLLDGGLQNSPWPMQGHDTRHTGRSPYSTAINPGIEKWRFDAGDYVDGSAIIDDNGIIYFGSHDGYFYAIYPNGTQKWKLKLNWNIGEFGSSPAIDENGIIYVGNTIISSGLYAINPDGTLKWKYSTGDIATSPAIGNDGTIYFGCEDNNIYALYPNDTLRWKYMTGHAVQSSPAIGQDGTVYCGSHDNYLYALYPNNGTVKWKFPTGGWVHGSPTIGSDNTIYIGSDDGFLYALYPNNGTMKWKCNIGSMRSSPSLDTEGTLYFGVWENRFHAVYPNGTIKWSFDPGEKSGIWGSTAAVSSDGTIYFGTCVDIGNCKGGDIIALNPDGTEKWRKRIADDWITSSPCISEDGAVYIGSSSCINGENFGYLHAFAQLDSNAPSAPNINGPTSGTAGTSYEYTFKSTSPLDRDVYYYVDWDDNTITDWTGPYASGQTVTINHTWNAKGTYTIQARAKDTENLWGPWATLKVTVPVNLQISQSNSLQINEQSSNQLLLKMTQRLLLNIR